MQRLSSLLALVVLTGCAVAPDADTDDAEVTGTSSAELTVPGVTLPKGVIQPPPLIPWPPPIVFIPLPAPTCTTSQNRFSVLTRSCEPFRDSRGHFSARPVFTSAQGTLCEMQWHPDRIVDVAPVPYASLVRIAERDTASLGGAEPAIVPLCDVTSVCGPESSSCPERARVPAPSGPVLIEGMGGCSACAFVDGSTLYAVLPPDYASGTIAIEVGPTVLHFSPGGAQTFSADVSSVPSRTSGFARVTRR